MTVTVQGVNNLPAEDEMPVIQPVRELPAGEPGGNSVSPSGQMADPQVVQVVQEKIICHVRRVNTAAAWHRA